MLDYWISSFVTFLFIFSASSESLTEGKEKSTDLTIKTVTLNTTIASIKCPDLQDKEKESFTISLLKEYEIHTTHFEQTEISNSSKTTQRFHVNITNTSIHYLVEMPQVNDTGLYRCKIQDRTTETYLIVKDPVLCPNEGKTLTWILLTTGCGLLTLYNFICTVFAWYFGWNLKCGETHESDYFNTRPGEFQRAR